MSDFDKYMQLTTRQRILGYDIEIYEEDAFVVFKNLDKSIYAIFHNDFTGLRELVHTSTIFGYNNYFYDDIIVSAMMDCWTPEQLKRLNDDLIVRREKKYPSKHIHSLDCFQQIDVSKPGLKKIEANKGVSIEESPIPFDIGRKLTPAEYEKALGYCCYDVDQTIDIFFDRFEEYFLVKKMLVDMKPSLPPNAYRWNTTTLSANVLVDKPTTKWSTIRVPEELLELVPIDVRHMWETKEKGTITIREFDNDIAFAFGGAHSANVKQKKFKNVRLKDVTSLYPNIIVNFNILGSATEVFRGIKDERARIKHTEPVRQEALKTIINSISGLLKSEYSLLYNPKASVTMCAIGQIVLYDLGKRLAPTCTIVQLNTDGVAFVPHTDDYKYICEQWEKDHNFQLEEDFYEVLIQKDVNNYIAKKPDKILPDKTVKKGSIKCKGSDVNNYHKDAWKKPNITRVVDIAIVDYLLYGTPVLDTMLENLDKPHLFQYVLHTGGTYDGTFDTEGNQYNKVNRVFATKKGDFCVYKKKGETLAKFPNAPNLMYLWNRDTSEIENFGKIVDLNHYYDILLKKLEKWE